MDATKFRCRKCREVLIDFTYLVDERGHCLQQDPGSSPGSDSESNPSTGSSTSSSASAATGSSDGSLQADGISIDDKHLVDNHDTKTIKTGVVSTNSSLALACSQTLLYVNPDKTPAWILNIIDKGQYQKGKLNCPKCQARVGAYDFMTAVKCGCGKHITPPVRIARNRVDEVQHTNLDQLHQRMGRKCYSQESGQSHEVNSRSVSARSENAALNSQDNVLQLGAFNSDLQDEEPTGQAQSDDKSARAQYPHIDGKVQKDSSKADGAVPRSLPPYQVIQDETPIAFGADHKKEEGNEDLSLQVVKENRDTLEETLPDAYICPICLELIYLPHTCQPCKHVFCSPCLRLLHGTSYFNTKCPLCRETIVKCFPDDQLNNEIISQFPEEYHLRKVSEKKNKKNLPSLPGSEGPFQFLRRGANNNNRANGGSETLAVWGGVCFVILLMMLGFTVFATTVGFVLWYLMEVALDIIAELMFELNEFLNFSWQALIIFCIEGNIPQDLSDVLMGSAGRIVGSFVKLVNRTKIFVNEGEVPREPPVAYMVSFDVQNGTNRLLTKVTQANIANYIVLGVVFTYVLYRIAKYRQQINNQ